MLTRAELRRGRGAVPTRNGPCAGGHWLEHDLSMAVGSSERLSSGMLKSVENYNN